MGILSSCIVSFYVSFHLAVNKSCPQEVQATWLFFFFFTNVWCQMVYTAAKVSVGDLNKLLVIACITKHATERQGLIVSHYTYRFLLWIITSGVSYRNTRPVWRWMCGVKIGVAMSPRTAV